MVTGIKRDGTRTDSTGRFYKRLAECGQIRAGAVGLRMGVDECGQEWTGADMKVVKAITSERND